VICTANVSDIHTIFELMIPSIDPCRCQLILLLALIAVEELSFGSKTVKHSQSIDDIAIANNIAGCAEGFAKQAYGFYWRWEDWGGDDLVDQPFLPSSVGAKSSNANQRKNNSNGKNDASKALSPPRRGLLGMLTQSNNVDEDEPFTIFGFKCGAPMCGR